MCNYSLQCAAFPHRGYALSALADTAIVMLTGAPARLIAEMRLVEGTVPDALDNARTVTPTYQISRDAFLLHLPNGVGFHYRRGAGVTYARPIGVAESDVILFFGGSVYGAIAWLNGLVPLHASAIVHDGGVYAFSGASGEGKSTLVAALAQRGFAVASDDVLALDLNDPHRIVALPGPARIKLWHDALALTGQTAGAAVRPEIAKFYVTSDLTFGSEPLPLRRLYLLYSAVDAFPDVVPILGAERFAAVRSTYYQPQFCGAITPQATYFGITARLASSVPMARFSRSRDPSDFSAGIATIETDLRG